MAAAETVNVAEQAVDVSERVKQLLARADELITTLGAQLEALPDKDDTVMTRKQQEERFRLEQRLRRHPSILRNGVQVLREIVSQLQEKRPVLQKFEAARDGIVNYIENREWQREQGSEITRQSFADSAHRSLRMIDKGVTVEDGFGMPSVLMRMLNRHGVSDVAGHGGIELQTILIERLERDLARVAGYLEGNIKSIEEAMN